MHPVGRFFVDRQFVHGLSFFEIIIRMSNPEHPNDYAEDIDAVLHCLERAMGTCVLLLDSGGCRRGRSLCDDEIGVETACPGQILRWYISSGIPDYAFAGHHILFESPIQRSSVENELEVD